MARFQILALDGGGIRGMYSAAVLAKLEEKHGVDVLSHFDLITGTSTGGIIAIGLGLGMKPREILRFYANEGPRIFGHRFEWRRLLHLFRRKYSSRHLAKALSDFNAFGNNCLGNSSVRLVIPTYDLAHDKVRLFKTPHHPRLRSDWRLPAWQVAMATSAAPTYFPACRDVEHARLIDGGVWANNPTMVGIVEAYDMLNVPLEDIHVLSLGTTHDRVRRHRSLDNGGLWGWRKIGIDVLMRGQSAGTNGLAEHLIGSKRLLRLDPIVPKAMALDKVNEEQFLHLAEDVARHEGPVIAERFFDHIASPYHPIYPERLETA